MSAPATELALFPLRTVLFPGGRMGLRIFERRYLDMVRDTLREQASFGIVWMPEGGKEVMSPGERPASLALIGTEARIADWNQQPIAVCIWELWTGWQNHLISPCRPAVRNYTICCASLVSTLMFSVWG